MHEPCLNPVYILWFNSLGAPDQFLFSGSQKIEAVVTIESTYAANYTSIFYTTNPKRSTTKREQRTMRLGAKSLNRNEKDALFEIMTSPAVWIVDSELNPIYRVNPVAGTFQIYDNTTVLTDIEFEIELPETLTYGN